MVPIYSLAIGPIIRPDGTPAAGAEWRITPTATEGRPFLVAPNDVTGTQVVVSGDTSGDLDDKGEATAKLASSKVVGSNYQIDVLGGQAEFSMPASNAALSALIVPQPAPPEPIQLPTVRRVGQDDTFANLTYQQWRGVALNIDLLPDGLMWLECRLVSGTSVDLKCISTAWRTQDLLALPTPKIRPTTPEDVIGVITPEVDTHAELTSFSSGTSFFVGNQGVNATGQREIAVFRAGGSDSSLAEYVLDVYQLA